MFTKDIFPHLGYYVYRLIDPRNGETFYVGKGKENRVFDHVNQQLGASEEEDEVSLKKVTIQQILNANLEPIHVIHRHGLTESEALLAEAVLIDAIPGLSNIQAGRGSNDFGPMHVTEIQNRYVLPTAELSHPVMLIKINRSLDRALRYDATRYAWRINVARARAAEYILSVTHGVIQGVFVAQDWREATRQNFPGFPEAPAGRHGFVGVEAPDYIQEHYVNKRIPDRFSQKGASNPVMYSY
ncbi:MAG: hypothetical protein AAFQ98_12110 [Bacteroidota bacterium]